MNLIYVKPNNELMRSIGRDRRVGETRARRLNNLTTKKRLLIEVERIERNQTRSE